MPRPRKERGDLSPEVRAVLRNSPNLEPCRKFRRVSATKFLAHVKEARCQRCIAFYEQLTWEMDLMQFLRDQRN
jgi:hypothetical protein